MRRDQQEKITYLKIQKPLRSAEAFMLIIDKSLFF
jgi:hypothetical protein